MKNENVNKIAEEIYNECVSSESKEPFSETGKSCHTFYRRIARWHLRCIEKMVQGNLFKDHKDSYRQEVRKKCSGE
jgi:hypothetical protein